VFTVIDTKGRRLAVETHLQSRVYLHSTKLTKSSVAEALMIRIIIIVIIILIIISETVNGVVVAVAFVV
jgi:hypothetical protein